MEHATIPATKIRNTKQQTMSVQDLKRLVEHMKHVYVALVNENRKSNMDYDTIDCNYQYLYFILPIYFVYYSLLITKSHAHLFDDRQ